MESTSAAAVPPKCYSACIKQVRKRLISSGNLIQASKVPLVNVHSSAEFPGSYEVTIIMYLPDYAANVDLDQNSYPCLDNIQSVKTEAGTIDARIIGIYYDKPDYIDPKTQIEVYLYSIWEMRIRYQVIGKPAQAIWVRYVIDDPETTTGPITTVEKPE